MNAAKTGVQVPTAEPKTLSPGRRNKVGTGAFAASGDRKHARLTGGKGVTHYGGGKTGGFGMIGRSVAGSTR